MVDKRRKSAFEFGPLDRDVVVQKNKNHVLRHLPEHRLTVFIDSNSGMNMTELKDNQNVDLLEGSRNAASSTRTRCLPQVAL